MNVLCLNADPHAASLPRNIASRCTKCSPSTSGRVFTAPPAIERMQTRHCSEGVMQAGHSSSSADRRWSRIEAVKSNKSKEREEESTASQSGGGFTGLVNDLLFGAASRMERGRTTCIQCKGAGTCTCSNCKGQGIVQPSKLKKASDPVRQAASKVSSMFGSDSSTQYSHMLRSNRCQKCHGAGVRACTACHGLGFRGDDAE